MVAYPTDRDLLSLSPESFFQQVVKDALDARALVEGPNFYFGRDRRGDVQVLSRLASEANVTLTIVEPLQGEGGIVSSSRIRGLIAAGDVAAAGRLLTRPYRLRGMVVHGARRGASIGFPTANLEGIDTLIPAHGVYAGAAWPDDRRWAAAINIGPNPTFGEHAVKSEVHNLGFGESLYGRAIEIEFLARLRDIKTFSSKEELIAQLDQDVKKSSEIANQ
jgi:riboflavin kinase/FMN adenylyltransferase